MFVCVLAGALLLAAVAPFSVLGDDASCDGRCLIEYDYTLSCQCNTECPYYGNCCDDWDTFCAGVCKDLSEVSQEMWEMDADRLTTEEVTVDPQVEVVTSDIQDLSPNKLFSYVDTTQLTSPIYVKYLALLDNYIADQGIAENVTDDRLAEESEFLDELLTTAPIEALYESLECRGMVSDRTGLREMLQRHWFDLYPRSGSSTIPDTSGFEHVMLGEYKSSSSVNGMHYWLAFYEGEERGEFEYYGHVGPTGTNFVNAMFTWNDHIKSQSSFFLRSSPAFDMAVYSLCFGVIPGKVCPVTMDGERYEISTYSDDGHIATAYADFIAKEGVASTAESAPDDDESDDDDVEWSDSSCVGRCIDDYMSGYSCQCDTDCPVYGNCCEDYETTCLNPGTDYDCPAISEVSQAMWYWDADRLSTTEVTIDPQAEVQLSLPEDMSSSRLFTYVDTSRLSSPIYVKYLALLDNYIADPETAETVTDEELAEESDFLDELITTGPIDHLYDALECRGMITNRTELREILQRHWFDLYPRSGSSTIPDTSGFEHVMLGEYKSSSSVNGMHYWLAFYEGEERGEFEYYGHVGPTGTNYINTMYTWDGRLKTQSSFFLRSSPAFDMAMYSLCFELFPNTPCSIVVDDVQYEVQTYSSGGHIATAYPEMIGPVETTETTENPEANSGSRLRPPFYRFGLELLLTFFLSKAVQNFIVCIR